MTDQPGEPGYETRADAWARRGYMCAVFLWPAAVVIGIWLMRQGDPRGARVLKWTGAIFGALMFVAIVATAADASPI